VKTMDIDNIVEAIKGYAGRSRALGLWELNTLGKGGHTGFYFRTIYEINKVVKEDHRVKVLIDVQLFDSWELFQQEAKRIFVNVVKAQLMDRLPGTEEILDIVITETEGVNQ
jgi:hypothetical protein